VPTGRFINLWLTHVGMRNILSSLICGLICVSKIAKLSLTLFKMNPTFYRLMSMFFILIPIIGITFHVDQQQNFDQKRQTSSNIFPNVLLADFSSLELRDMMSSVIIRGWWQMSSWEIQYLAQIWVQVALGNIVSCQKHYIKEYCKP